MNNDEDDILIETENKFYVSNVEGFFTSELICSNDLICSDDLILLS